MLTGGSATRRVTDLRVGAAGAPEGASPVNEELGRAMSFMGLSVPSDQPGVVSPWAAFRLHRRAHVDQSGMLLARYGTR